MYTIITLGNPERYQLRQAVHQAMAGIGYVEGRAVDGRKEDELKWWESHHGLEYRMSEWRPGELGLWYSNINNWKWIARQDDNVLVFEDDAIPLEGFRYVVDNVPPPEDFDFATYYTPFRRPYQGGKFRWEESNMQEHGNIAVLYSPKGAKKILDILGEEGLEYPVDIWLFKQAKFTKRLKGYAPRIIDKVVIDHDFDVPTNIHDEERIYRAVQRKGE
jgi:GR25 family glycosyltransferase involved in LPS biosynthesis